MALYLKDRQIEHLNNLLTLDIDHVEILRWDYHETIRYPRNILSCCLDTREADNYYEDAETGIRHRLTPGYLCFIPQDTRIRFHRTLDTTSITIHFSLEFIHGLDLYSAEKRITRCYDPEMTEGLKQCLNDPDKLRASCGIRSWIIRFCHDHWPARLPCPANAMLEAAPLFEYVRTHIDAELNVEALAEHLHQRPDVFSRAFKRKFGLPPHRFLTKALVRELSRRLADREKTIREIASELKFSSEFYLSRFFKQQTGIFPKEYRKRFSDRPDHPRAMPGTRFPH